jgi:hypothetical protein
LVSTFCAHCKNFVHAWRLKLYKKYWIQNQYQNVKINGIMFIMKNFTGQKFGIKWRKY